MNHAEETRTANEGAARGTTSRRRLPARALLSTLFLLSSLPLGLFWSVVLVVLLSAGLPLTVVWVGLPVLALAMAVCVVGVGVERWRLAALLGARLSSPFRPLPRGTILDRLRGGAADPALWRGLLYLLLLFPVGLVELVVVLVMAVSVFLVSYPLWFWTYPDGQGVMWTGAFVADTAPESLLVMFFGLVVMAAAVAFALQVSRRTPR